MGEIKATYEIFLRNLSGKAHVEDLCVNLRMISKGMLKEQYMKGMLKEQYMKAEFEFN